MSKQEDDVRVVLFSSLAQLLKQKSVENISVKEVIELSGISRATFYRYFKDKYELMCWFYDSLVSESNLYAFLIDMPWSHSLPIYSAIYEKDKVLFAKIASYNGQNSFREYLYNYTYNLFCERAKHRQINPEENPLNLAIQCFSYGLSSLTIKWLLGEIPLSREEFDTFRGQCAPAIMQDLLK